MLVGLFWIVAKLSQWKHKKIKEKMKTSVDIVDVAESDINVSIDATDA